MKHRIVLAIVVLQTILVLCCLFYLKNRIETGTEIVVKMAIRQSYDISNIANNEHTISLHYWDEESIPMRDDVRTQLIDTYYKKAWLVFDIVKNEEGYNDIRYLSLDEPVDEPLYIEVYASDQFREDDKRGERDNLELIIEGSVSYNTSKEKLEVIRNIFNTHSDLKDTASIKPLEVGVQMIINKKIVFINSLTINGSQY